MGMRIVIHDEMGLVMAGILSFTQLYLYYIDFVLQVVCIGKKVHFTLSLDSTQMF